MDMLIILIDLFTDVHMSKLTKLYILKDYIYCLLMVSLKSYTIFTWTKLIFGVVVPKKGHEGEFWCEFSIAQYGYIYQKMAKKKKAVYFGLVHFTDLSSNFIHINFTKKVVKGLKVMSME